jgi:hypothetical protein
MLAEQEQRALQQQKDEEQARARQQAAEEANRSQMEEKELQIAYGYFAMYVVMIESCAKTNPEMRELAAKPWMIVPIGNERTRLEAMLGTAEFQSTLAAMRQDAAREKRSIPQERDCKQLLNLNR